MPHLLIIDAPYYAHISADLRAGAEAAIAAAGATSDYVAVPGVLEIPAAIAMASDAEEIGGTAYDGYVLLGCVIRGETTHYEVVSNESARAIMQLSIAEALAIGNGILTVENEAQALARARIGEMNKGGGAAEAALAMIALREKFSEPAGA
ncbi:6,7-dimethyl-8-ribityllumazine synthase [Rhizobiaceae bacterium]|nr:6,7-dimethyl-8-ribityllumazine synthase [Rhizobiaceae bacterium]